MGQLGGSDLSACFSFSLDQSFFKGLLFLFRKMKLLETQEGCTETDYLLWLVLRTSTLSSLCAHHRQVTWPIPMPKGQELYSTHQEATTSVWIKGDMNEWG